MTHPTRTHTPHEISDPTPVTVAKTADTSVTSEEVTHPYPGLTVHKLKGNIEPVFMDVPTYFICPNCNFEGNTKVKRAKGPLFTFCFWSPMCWMCEMCDDFEHSCPQCRVVLGSYTDFLD